jgi:HK97 family phage major capsid protein
MDFNELSAEMQKSLTEFRSYVEREIKEVKANGAAAPETKEALDRINKRIDELQAKAERPAPNAPNGEKSEYAKAFDKFARTGDTAGVEKAMDTTGNSGADGGYTIPVELDREIYSLAMSLCPMRGLANVIQVGSDNYQKLVNLHGTASGWVGETAARPATNASQFARLTPSMGEIYANPQTTQKLLDDSFFSVEGFIADEVSQEFAKQEGPTFISGDGTNKPKGILAGTVALTADGTRAFGSIQAVKTGVAGGWPASNPFDIVLDLIYTLKAAHRQGASFMTNKALLGEMRKFKDSTGNYLWQPSNQAGQPSQFAGYPIVECEDVAAKAASSLSLIFANFKRAYTIVDRIGTRVLRDPFTNKPYVGFYTTKRVGGMLVDSEAVKVLQFAV